MGDMVCWHGVHRTILSRLSSARPGETYLYRFNFDSPSLNHARLLCAGKETAGMKSKLHFKELEVYAKIYF